MPFASNSASITSSCVDELLYFAIHIDHADYWSTQNQLSA